MLFEFLHLQDRGHGLLYASLILTVSPRSKGTPVPTKQWLKIIHHFKVQLAIGKEKCLQRLVYTGFGARKKIKALQRFRKGNAAGALHAGTGLPEAILIASQHSNLKPPWSNLAGYQAGQLQLRFKYKISQAGSLACGSLLKTKILLLSYRYLKCVQLPSVALHYICSFFLLKKVGRYKYCSYHSIRNTQTRKIF